MQSILATIILYQTGLAESSTYRSLSRSLAAHPTLAAALSLHLFDNSSAPQPLPPNLTGLYHHDGTNPGLAQRYHTALSLAAEAGATWLLLLDQDTQLTSAYLDELLHLANQLAPQQEIAAIVPKLVSKGRHLSPHAPSYRASPFIPSGTTYGALTGLTRAFNSGALLRVASLQSIGGFPESYWLDYLDHAVFHRLQSAGGRVFVMHASLEHDMSELRPGHHTGEANARRHTNQLAAELRFYREHGSPAEQRLHRKDLVRKARAALKSLHLAKFVRLIKAALSPAPTSQDAQS